MATISDIYRITSKASLGGIKAATKAVVSHGASIAGMARKAAAAAGKVLKAAFSLKTLGNLAKVAGRGLSVLTRGLGILLTGGLLLVIGALRLLPGLIDGMRTAMEGAGDAATGAASNLEDVTDAAGAAASGISNTTDVIEESTQKVEGVLGAFGKVGPGFIQAQGKVFEQSEAMSEGAIDAAEAANEAMEDYDDAVGGAVQSTSRFGSALDRIGAAWTAAKNTILRAIAVAITPALEALAELMESPEFQEFVKLLAEDLADAVAAVGKWFVDTAIPAIQDFMVAVSDAGGPVEFLKKKWNELKDRVLKAIADMQTKARGFRDKIAAAFRAMQNRAQEFGDKVQGTIEAVFIFIDRVFGVDIPGIVTDALNNLVRLWEEKQDEIIALVKQAFINAIPATIRSALLTLSALWTAHGDSLVETMKGAINRFLTLLQRGINKARDIINPFIRLFNLVAGETGGFTIPEIPPINIPLLQRGGITKLPFMAVVGDTPGPEVIAPLADLEGILRNTFGLPDAPVTTAQPVGGTIIEKIIFNIGLDPGGLSPAAAGQQAMDSFIETGRRRGLQFSMRS